MVFLSPLLLLLIYSTGMFDQINNVIFGSELGSIEERLKILEEKICKTFDVEKENKKMKDLLKTQEKQINAILDENYKMKKKAREQEEKIRDLKQSMRIFRNTYDETIQMLAKRIRTDDAMNENRRFVLSGDVPIKPAQQNDSSVAFSALADTLLTLNAGDKVAFGYVQMNEGDGYNASSGIFTCPRSGLYLFSYNVLSFCSKEYGGDAVGVLLMVKGLEVLMSVEMCPAMDKNYNVQGTSVARLETNDLVWLEAGVNGTFVFFVNSYFTGIRISD